MRIKLETKPFTRNYPLRLAVVAAFALVAVIMVATGNSPWGHSESYQDGVSWAKIFHANGELNWASCSGMSPTMRSFDVSEFQAGCREYAASVGVEQK